MVLVAQQAGHANSRVGVNEDGPYPDGKDGRVNDDARDGDEEGDVDDGETLAEPVEGVKRKAGPVINSQLEKVVDVVLPMPPLVKHIVVI